jgi:hypothetical protein
MGDIYVRTGANLSMFEKGIIHSSSFFIIGCLLLQMAPAE